MNKEHKKEASLAKKAERVRKIVEGGSLEEVRNVFLSMDIMVRVRS